MNRAPDLQRCHGAVHPGACEIAQVARAARTGRGESEIIEQALRRDLGLDLLERIRAKTRMPEDEARALAVEAQHAARRRRR